MTEAEMTGMLEKAAEAGAKRALASIGLEDAEASNDLRDLRGTLKMMRAVRASFVRQVIDRVVTVAIVAATAWFVARGGLS